MSNPFRDLARWMVVQMKTENEAYLFALRVSPIAHRAVHHQDDQLVYTQLRHLSDCVRSVSGCSHTCLHVNICRIDRRYYAYYADLSVTRDNSKHQISHMTLISAI